MLGRSLILFALLASHVAFGLQNVAFDSAVASSTHSAGVASGTPKFGAAEALAAGSGYWCSSGAPSSKSASWTGVLDARRSAVGVKISWAYAPKEVKILSSADGANFEEAAPWRAIGRDADAFEESIMFSALKNVKALSIVMRGARKAFLGINSATLIAEPGPLMLVSGITSVAGEKCAVAEGAGVALKPCLDAIAAGDGREVFIFTGEGHLVNVASGKCLTLAGGDAMFGGKLAMGKCSDEFDLQPSGQLKMPKLGNYCVAITADRAFVQDCAEAEQSNDARDKFFASAVPEFNPKLVLGAKDSAALLAAASSSLSKWRGRLQAALPRLDSCAAAAALLAAKPMSLVGLAHKATRRTVAAPAEPETAAIAAIGAQLHIDDDALVSLIGDTSAKLLAAHSKLSR